MNRNITQELIKWKDQSGRKPLMIRGARQVGKSFSVMEFGQKYFQGKVHLLDFEKHPEWIQVFDRNLDSMNMICRIKGRFTLKPVLFLPIQHFANDREYLAAAYPKLYVRQKN